MTFVSLRGLSESMLPEDTGIESVEPLVTFPLEDDDKLKLDFPIVETIRQMTERKDRQRMMLEGK